MEASGYHQRNSDHILFLEKRQGKITILIVYVDDLKSQEMSWEKGRLYKVTCSKSSHDNPNP